MKTVIVEIKNDLAMNFLHNLEKMHILRIVENAPVSDQPKLSDRFAGCLTRERTDELQQELTLMRTEWERDI